MLTRGGWLKALAVLGLLLLGLAAPVATHPLEGLTQLTNLNYDHYFAEHKYILAYVDDLSKGCKKCAKARSIMEEALKQLPARFEFKLAYINRKTDSALLKQLKLFDNKVFAYLANRRAVPYRDDIWKAKSVAVWLKKRVLKPSIHFIDEQHFEGHERAHPRIIVYGGKRNKYYNIFRYIASSYEDLRFMHSFSPPVLDRRNRTVDFVKYPEKTSFTITVPFSAAELNELIETHNNVQRMLDAVTVSRIMTKEDLTFLLVHTDPSNPAVTHFFRTGLKMRERAVFISTPLVEGKFMKKIVRWLGIGPQHDKPYPCLRLIAREGGQMRKYEFTGKINEEAILKFYEDYRSGTLKPYFLSEEVPKSQGGTVKTLVGKTFDVTVNDKLKDVIVFFHSVWCQECKDLLPVFHQLAGRYTGFSDVQFAQLDNYNNEGRLVPDGLLGEPVMLLFKAEDKKHPVKYKGKWLKSDIQTWIESNLNLNIDL